MITIKFKQENKYWHRINGPVFFTSKGLQYWYLYNKKHRINGPAEIRSSGVKFYYLNGVPYSKKDYYNLINK